MERSR
jgi:hypothetical protein